jgi:hypothetical protein
MILSAVAGPESEPSEHNCSADRGGPGPASLEDQVSADALPRIS